MSLQEQEPKKSQASEDCTSTDDASVPSADTDSLLENIGLNQSKLWGMKEHKKKSGRRKPKLLSLNGSNKPSKSSPLHASRHTLESRSNADDRLRLFKAGEISLKINGEDHFYDPNEHKQYTLEEIGVIMGVSRERVRQIEEKSLRKLWRLMDAMGKREGVNKEEWLKLINNGDDDTHYMP